MFKRILLAYDGSEPAHKAFDECLEMSRRFAAELTIITVVRPPDYADDIGGEFQHELGKLRAQACAAGAASPMVHVRVGNDTAEQIIAAAEECEADLIVTGQRRRARLQRWLPRSVERTVLKSARCAVLVVR